MFSSVHKTSRGRQFGAAKQKHQTDQCDQMVYSEFDQTISKNWPNTTVKISLTS